MINHIVLWIGGAETVADMASGTGKQEIALLSLRRHQNSRTSQGYISIHFSLPARKEIIDLIRTHEV